MLAEGTTSGGKELDTVRCDVARRARVILSCAGS
jgi:hypothetical protein